MEKNLKTIMNNMLELKWRKQATCKKWGGCVKGNKNSNEQSKRKAKDQKHCNRNKKCF